MVNIINDLFKFFGYADQKSDNRNLYIPNKDRNRKEYWLVVKEDIEGITKNQDTYFKQCKDKCDDLDVDKNLSLLVLWETSGDIPTHVLREKVMLVEEDPYLFKKYVLYFSQKEVDAFKREMKNMEIGKFMSKKLISETTFDKYKKDPHGQTWQSLLYRVAIKLPFIPVSVKESNGLQSLIEANKDILKEKKLNKFNDSLIKYIRDMSTDELKDMPSNKIFDGLSFLLKGESDAD